ncbi:rod shape-determining protein RodA [Patescibacteria group bacterium]|nr:rod shape-determining protein RodA [Patescibacteria group bacterium]MBU2219827.1 rod shape-determining protein RodA [Patescibacteria group bacterium]MBU2265176.1 rod shape-determining protein RodA [Patescibacteria group bacterium]
MWTHLKKLDWLLIGSVLALCAISLLEIWSIDKGILASGRSSDFFVRQGIFLVGGLAAMLFLSLIDAQFYRNHSLFLVLAYFLSLVLLVAVILLGHKIRGTASWFKFGEFSFAPVELAKFMVILILAKYFSQRHVEVYRVRHIIVSGLYASLPIALVLLQPDLGSAIVLAAVWLGLVLLSGMKRRHLAWVLLAGVIISVLSWSFVFKTYQKERVLTFLNPAKDPLGYSYNLIQSKIAIGSGGWWGKGLGQGSQGQLNFLPEKHTDFIFSVFSEEWGFFGVVFFFVLYSLFFWRLMKIILAAGNNFFRLFVAGYAVMIFAQISINVGMCLGLLPITGIALPFLSYGGSNLLINLMMLGVVQNIAMQTKAGQIRMGD